MKKFALAVLMLGTAGTGAFAATVTCTNMTAAALQVLGTDGCQFGDKIFSNFSYTYTPYDGNASGPQASGVQIEFSYLNSDPLKPVLSLLGTWTADGGLGGDVYVDYQVSSVKPIVGAWVGLGGSVMYPGSGDVAILLVGETLVLGDQNNTQVQLGTNIVRSTEGTTTGYQAGSVSFAPVYSITDFSKDVRIIPGSGTATLTRIDEGLFETPEPMASLLVGGGFLLFGLLGGKKLKDRKN